MRDAYPLPTTYTVWHARFYHLLCFKFEFILQTCFYNPKSLQLPLTMTLQIWYNWCKLLQDHCQLCGVFAGCVLVYFGATLGSEGQAVLDYPLKYYSEDPGSGMLGLTSGM